MNADGTCHAGDLMEHGTPFVALYDAEELCRIVNAEKAEAWDEGKWACYSAERESRDGSALINPYARHLEH
ncbi:hypothetical protein FB382_004361 [Nocardioides ginsengisegetis]|uniref:Uncharacterized protein n=1 Tax=Nocardioides ginsengisegetis TaxID=661491 RepID=A0A7W3PBM8_9ACTN|nr:hypothetical protein [Nocardioides ginsengisegetis]MBA8805586.1 hypothetical protein [Nocardioides ginsengisegetis]MBA8806010.1 hypothetical protein [Nocardioides ginsengisegetis]